MGDITEMGHSTVPRFNPWHQSIDHKPRQNILVVSNGGRETSPSPPEQNNCEDEDAVESPGSCPRPETALAETGEGGREMCVCKQTRSGRHRGKEGVKSRAGVTGIGSRSMGVSMGL